MTSQRGLTEADRDFLRLVSSAAFSNPFGDERDDVDRAIVGDDGDLTRDELLMRVVECVQRRVCRMEEQGQADVRRYSGDDFELVASALLFDVFHRYLEDFDRLIEDQVRAGDTPCPVPFAGEAIGLIEGRGFPHDVAVRHFAFLYQLRRAFHFIDQDLVGRSPCMCQLRCRLWNNVFTSNLRWYALHLWDRLEDFATLLLGETGTGKGSAAAAIGRSGFIPFDEKKGCFAESFTRNFIAINLSQYPQTLIESELFGHRKGSFTGAIEHHEGVFSRCSPHGAIFLDEVGDVPETIQIKLLQVLQERTFVEVGSHEKNRFRGRVIAATNKPVADLRRSGRFREDFYYRLCSDVLEVPALRQRLAEEPAEMDDLLSLLLRRMFREPPRDLLSEVRRTIERDVGPTYPWTGNVRELEQAVRRIILTGSYPGDARANGEDLLGRLVEGMQTGTVDAQQLLSSYCRLLYQRHGTYEEVARRTGLDRRTAKRYVQMTEDPNRAAQPGSVRDGRCA
ncbi:MAG: sigma-54-dependent Fis family transcriptional regulator [Deltaproteobacteria bacterium]|nr:sigma-54-dependent Fis family transcriptional regulator [Deltaproteobacteria bacterium]